MTTALLVVIGWICGSMPWGYWLVRVFRGEDIRRQGSGNIGATNVWRVYGRRLGLAAAVLDTAENRWRAGAQQQGLALRHAQVSGERRRRRSSGSTSSERDGGCQPEYGHDHSFGP